MASFDILESVTSKTAADAMDWPVVSRREAKLASWISRPIPPIELASTGEQLAVCFKTASVLAVGEAVLVLEIEIAHRPAWLVAEKGNALRLAAMIAPGFAPYDLEDGELAALVIEALAQPLIEQFETFSGLPTAFLRLEQVLPSSLLEAVAPEAIGVALDQGGGIGPAFTFHAAPEVLDKLFARIGMRSLTESAWDWLPIGVSIRKGASRLSLAELNSLRVGDVLMADSFLDAMEAMGVLAEQWAFGGSIDGEHLVLNSAARPLMRHELEIWAMRAPAVGEVVSANDDATIGDLPVTVVFELARLDVPLGDLRTLAPGAVLPLGKAASKAVDLYAAGSKVGRGEIVTVDGQTGVRLTRIFGNG